MSEEQIKKDVVEQLYWDSRVNASDITVDVTDGKVTLEGTVPTVSVRQAAEADCFTVLGVTAVVNNLKVKHPRESTVPSDGEIENKIKSLLLWSPDVDATDINLSVVSGLVTLEGAVDSYWKKVKAEQLAGTIFGVVKIINDIVVVPTDRIVDKVIAKDLAGALDRHADINPDTINVEVTDGVVSLSGSVDNWREYRATEEVVRHTPGVVDVRNELIIA
ncbi:MAG: BON domain-containing protein [Desulfobacteraceae bacterium]